MTLLEDYRLTLEGELDVGAPDNIWTRFGAFRWAFRRWVLTRCQRPIIREDG